MKKIFLNILFLFLFIFTANISFGFEAKQVSKEEIDKIKCDLNFTGELLQGYNYTFNDTFINNSNKEVKVIGSEVNYYEEEDFNQSDFFSDIKFSNWAKEKNNIFVKGDRGVITELYDNYKINIGSKKSYYGNFIIKYTLGLYYKGPDGKFTDGPHPHTECKRYKVVGQEKEIKINTSLIKLPKILPKTGTPILERVVKRKDSRLSLDFLESRFKFAGNYNSDINFWLKNLNKIDRNKDKYLIIPSKGLVIPINSIKNGSKDYNNLINGKEINYNKYLKSGSLEYSGTSINGYGEDGNKVIFGHSSYWKNDDGRYKTDFGKIIELDKGEEIWIYVKKNGKFTRFKYQTVASYETNPENVSVLKPGEGKNLTLFTCTPIGGIKGRWIVESKFIDNDKIRLENKKEFKNIELSIKIKISNIIKKISKIKDGKNKILKIYNSIIIKEKQINKLEKTEKIIYIKDILEYIKYKISLEYYK